MRHKTITMLLVLIVGLGGVALLVGVVTHQARAMPTWEQANSDGFGDPRNQQIPSLAVFGDYLYAGTWNWDGITSTAQIWRSQTGVDWVMVDDRPAIGAAAMISFDGAIYAGSWDGHIWSSPDGLTWTDVITDGFDGSHQGISTFSVYADALYATTWYAGTEVWRTLDGVHWDPFVTDGLDDINNDGIPATETWLGQLYFGVKNLVSGAQVWRTDGITVTSVITDGFGTVTNRSVSALQDFGNMLYASVWNDLEGVKVYRTDTGQVWEQVLARAGEPFSWEVSALEVFHDHLYLVVGYSDGLQVWRTGNGTVWEQVGFEGFGDVNNQWSYWDNATTVFMDKLYVAANNFETGGEIWRITGENYKTFLPFALRPCPPLYQDDFSDPSSGWLVSENSHVRVGYLNGEYQIKIKAPNVIAAIYDDFGVSNYQLEVDLRAASHLDGAAGLFFGATDYGFYTFEISDGWYVVWRNDSDPWIWTPLIDWTPSAAINPGNQSNHLKVVRNGTAISVYANNQLLGTTYDGTYLGSGLGMASEAFDTANYDARFDNFTIYAGCGANKLSAPSFDLFWRNQGAALPKP